MGQFLRWSFATCLLLAAIHLSDGSKSSSRHPATARSTTRELSSFVNNLWDHDTNRVSVHVNFQGHTSAKSKSDVAHNRLFGHVSRAILNKPTYKTFLALLNNYEHSTGRAEVITQHEISEMNAFLNAICNTTVMRQTHGFLVRKGLSSRSLGSFKAQLRNMWFSTYSRSRGPMDSSGFEHVFVGEIKNGRVSGLHNWLQLYTEEQNEHLNYMGWIYKKNPHILALRFKWLSKMKKISSIMIGSSPEFDIAIMTTCFLMNPPGGNCRFSIKRHNLNMRIYKDRRAPGKVATAYFN